VIDEATAERFATIALSHVAREYPHKLDHVLESDSDLLAPRVLHPIFFGSYDWHSCVHGWWLLLTVRRLYPNMQASADIEALAHTSFTPDKAAVELAYVRKDSSRAFERPYGWAWLMALHLEASRDSDRSWSDALRPLADAFAERFRDYLSILTYPIRAGTHFNTAFAIVLALEWADSFDPELAAAMRERSIAWFGADRDCQAWEPSGDAFLSPALTEALCMAKALPAADFRTWFAAFLPRVAVHEPMSLFEPATVSDRSDGKIAHLDGVNFSRAWCWRTLAPLLGPTERTVAEEAADRHLAAALPHVAGDYMGEHWLASFALLALLVS
jgi:hypothetical protein